MRSDCDFGLRIADLGTSHRTPFAKSEIRNPKSEITFYAQPSHQ